jgi:hypothetical protein
MEILQSDSHSPMVEYGLMAFALALLFATFLSWGASFHNAAPKACNLNTLSVYVPTRG